MRTFKLTVAEIHTAEYEVEAENIIDAVNRFSAGEATVIDDSTEYSQIAEDAGFNGVLTVIDESGGKEVDSDTLIEMFEKKRMNSSSNH